MILCMLTVVPLPRPLSAHMFLVSMTLKPTVIYKIGSSLPNSSDAALQLLLALIQNIGCNFLHVVR